jgi:hypothetical protein
MAQPLHTGGKRGIIPGFWTAGITRSLEVHDPVDMVNDGLEALENIRGVLLEVLYEVV